MVLDYVTIVSYSILLNAKPQLMLKPTKGLRQSDPLSLYLFIIYAEVFSSLFYHAERLGCISSVPIGSSLVAINYLFFADNYLLFCKANSIKWSNMVSLLCLYEHASGQFLNKEKIALFFNKNTPRMSNTTCLLLLVLRLRVHLRNI